MATTFSVHFPIAAEYQVRHHRRMGSGSNPSKRPDLFSAQQPPGTSSPSYALPTNLSSALSYLDNDQIDRLLAAVLTEQQARGGKKPPQQLAPKRFIKDVALPLAQGKLNAVRAAFKAGVTPSRIARQFGIPQSDVRKALASDQA
jgi:hypothetical protein